MGLRIRVDKNACQSAGRCVALAPEAFALDEDHLADALPRALALSREKLLRIGRSCPAQAIRLFDESGEEVDLEAADG